MSIVISSTLSSDSNNFKKKNFKIPAKCITALEKAFESKTEWNSIYLSAFITFLSAMQFSLFFSSLWSFMKMVCFIICLI